MCQSETMHQIIDFFSVNNKKEKTNDDITDNEDSNNNNKCVSVSVCENWKKKQVENKMWNRIKNTKGKYKYDIDSIIDEQIKFYSKLFTTEGWDENSANKLTQHIESKLNGNFCGFRFLCIIFLT
jgi:hypothetical protein